MQITKCWGKEKVPPQNVGRCAGVATAVPMDQPTDCLLNSNENLLLASHGGRRKHLREVCSIKANYMVQGHWHGGSIQNITEGGCLHRNFSEQDVFFRRGHLCGCSNQSFA